MRSTTTERKIHESRKLCSEPSFVIFASTSKQIKAKVYLRALQTNNARYKESDDYSALEKWTDTKKKFKTLAWIMNRDNKAEVRFLASIAFEARCGFSETKWMLSQL